MSQLRPRQQAPLGICRAGGGNRAVGIRCCGFLLGEKADGYGTPVSPRHVPASVTELSRVELLSSLPGQTLARLADRMQREDVPPGRTIVSEGEEGDRFYVLLSGLAGVSQQTRGARAMIRPGDWFGEVALAMGVPRTATVTTMTPCVVASCDRATFDELLRPLFADDEP